MADNNKWIRRVLFKLNELFLNGSDFDDRRWKFDWDENLKKSTNLNNVWNEDRALETLTKAGIIESRSLVNRYREEVLSSMEMHGKNATVYGDWYTTDPARREYEYERWIDAFNYKSFQRFCELHGFNPSNNGITCKLEILSGVTPVIHAQGAKHSLLSLEAGSIPQAVVQYAAKKFDIEIPLDELRQNINHVQLKSDNANLKQFFKNNVFTAEKALGMFAQITPKTFLLKHEALLTSGELASIEKISTN
jgi:hypothetical protein